VGYALRSLRKKTAIFCSVFLYFFCSSILASDQILLKNAKIYTMGAPGILSEGMILIKDGRIEKIGPDISVPSNVKVLDLSGKTIIPGLVCASLALFMEKKDLRHAGEESHDTDILEGIHYFDPQVPQILEHGITTAYISPVSFRSIGGLGAVVKVHSGEVGSISILKDKAALNIRLDRLQDNKTSNVLRLIQYHRVRDQFKRAEEYRKEWTDYSKKLEKYEEENKKLEVNKKEEPKKKPAKKVPASKKPDKPKRDASKEILIRAMEKRIPVRFIVHRPDSILQAMRLSEEFGLRVILEQTEDWPQLLDEMDKASVSLLSNPVLDYRSFLIPGREKGYAAGFLQVQDGDLYYPYKASAGAPQDSRSAWKELEGSGVPFALIPPDRFPLSARYIRFYAAVLLSHKVSREFALGAVTSSAAEILGVSERVGSLEEGKDADLVVLDGEPLNSLSKIEIVFSDGTTVWEKKR
jgi:imidazolonepropionase-like amidohydrolase